eukprot:10111069-Alexandrium_andersonii.AAC.1
MPSACLCLAETSRFMLGQASCAPGVRLNSWGPPARDGCGRAGRAATAAAPLGAGWTGSASKKMWQS